MTALAIVAALSTSITALEAALENKAAAGAQAATDLADTNTALTALKDKVDTATAAATPPVLVPPVAGTVTNPDGSVSVTTDNSDGTFIVVTTAVDGTVTTVHKKADGTVIA